MLSLYKNFLYLSNLKKKGGRKHIIRFQTPTLTFVAEA